MKLQYLVSIINMQANTLLLFLPFLWGYPSVGWSTTLVQTLNIYWIDSQTVVVQIGTDRMIGLRIFTHAGTMILMIDTRRFNMLLPHVYCM